PEPEPDFTPGNPDKYVELQQLRNRSKGWTIQLVAGNLEQTALNVISRYPSLDEMVYTLGERKGEPWFMVFYGNYSTKDEARTAVDRLPDSLVSRPPWVRTTDGL
ncbi:SPOR domain-containing protein, partial [Marinobacter sp. F3R11]|uniref:SPOR domain-containing protein n=1 Tax=Marinobacter sp. F3R11 TaxID=2267231 RepID=UPI0021C6C428